MTDQENQRLEGYGFRVGAELHALSDRAIQPFDAAGIARAVAAERPRRIHMLPVGWQWLSHGRGPMLAIIVLASTLLAVWAGVGQRPWLPATFAPGSIAFARDGDLYVAASDGSRPIRVAEGHQPNVDPEGIRHFAFSPDRRYLAFGKDDDPVTGRETLRIVSADGTTTAIYTWGGHQPGAPGVGGLSFAWAPDSSRLAVYPGATDGEIAVVGIDGDPIGVLRLPSGASFMTAHGQLFARLSWSPDSTWLAVSVVFGGDVSPCAGDDGLATCYILLATDGSGARGASDDRSGYLAWAPDSRAAMTHFAPGTIEIRPPDGSAPQMIALATSVNPGDGHVLAWSPDGTRLAVASQSAAPPRNTLLVIDEGGTVHPAPIDDHFTGNGSNVNDLAWSVDGQRLLFGGYSSDGRSGIWSIDVGGGSPTLLVDFVDGYFDVADGRP